VAPLSPRDLQRPAGPALRPQRDTFPQGEWREAHDSCPHFPPTRAAGRPRRELSPREPPPACADANADAWVVPPRYPAGSKMSHTGSPCGTLPPEPSSLVVAGCDPRLAALWMGERAAPPLLGGSDSGPAGRTWISGSGPFQRSAGGTTLPPAMRCCRHSLVCLRKTAQGAAGGVASVADPPRCCGSGSPASVGNRWAASGGHAPELLRHLGPL